MTETSALFGPTYGFGAYIHWPYCARICPYCDFNVYAAKERNTDPLVEAIIQDLKTQARALPDHPKLDTVFLGGGTPSLMTATQIERLLSACDSAFGLASDCEITLEANPNNVSEASARDWRQAGINRLSIGLQSLDEQALRFLGRDHTGKEARTAAAIAHAVFPTFSLDMIYARPGQSLAAWEQELSAALFLEAPHLSLYELTIAPGTAFHKSAERGTLSALDDALQADMYELTDEMTRRAGVSAYEISNHAATASDQSRHNMIYWRSGDWLGLGPGAHGRLSVNGTRLATENMAKPDAYIKAVTETGSGFLERTALTRDETGQELITMGLRPMVGLERQRFEGLRSAPIPDATLLHLRSGGWLTHTPGTLALTQSGRLLADRIALELTG